MQYKCLYLEALGSVFTIIEYGWPFAVHSYSVCVATKRSRIELGSSIVHTQEQYW